MYLIRQDFSLNFYFLNEKSQILRYFFKLNFYCSTQIQLFFVSTWWNQYCFQIYFSIETYRLFRDMALWLIYFPDVLASAQVVDLSLADEKIPTFCVYSSKLHSLNVSIAFYVPFFLFVHTSKIFFKNKTQSQVQLISHKHNHLDNFAWYQFRIIFFISFFRLQTSKISLKHFSVFIEFHKIRFVDNSQIVSQSDTI